MDETVKDVLKKWSKQSPKPNNDNIKDSNEDKVDMKIKNIIEKQQSQVVEKSKRNVDKELKRMVLEQYATASGDER